MYGSNRWNTRIYSLIVEDVCEDGKNLEEGLDDFKKEGRRRKEMKGGARPYKQRAYQKESSGYSVVIKQD